MYRETLKKALIENNQGEIYISDKEKLDYYRRLSIPYYKNGKRKRFINQILDGNGNELQRMKFFECTSSSRLCFELFSWMANSSEITDIELEYHLPPLKATYPMKAKGDNMDVFFIYNKDLYFIESKYLEDTKNTISSIPKSYYIPGRRNNNNKLSLEDRYWNNYQLAYLLPDFILEMIDYSKSYVFGRKFNSFDLKQMITHLYGLCQFIYRNQDKLNNRTIYFYELKYDFGKEESMLSKYYKERVIELVNDYIRLLNLKLNFIFDYVYMQDYIKNIPDNILSFGSDKNIFEILSQFNLYKK